MNKTFLLGSIVVLATAVGANFYFDNQRENAGRGAIAKLESALILPEKVQSAEKSVFYVQGDYKFSATAFLIDSACGIFASNAHVADDIAQSKGTVILEQASTGKSVAVKSVRSHPANELFERLVDLYGPVSVFTTGSLQPIPVGYAYDVGLLYTKDKNCKGGEDLSAIPALKIADDASLAKLRAGDPIVSIGFPGNGTTTKGIEDLTLVARVEVGHVRALGSFVPVAADAHLERIHNLHTRRATPGASGSPNV